MPTYRYRGQRASVCKRGYIQTDDLPGYVKALFDAGWHRLEVRSTDNRIVAEITRHPDTRRRTWWWSERDE